MTTLSVPITSTQEKFIKELVKSGKAANKAHAVRLSIDALAEDEAFLSLQRSLQDARDGRVLYGDPRELIKKF
jgi:Arc/MetJ-type ribon-helix-helix transcriptional regulator